VPRASGAESTSAGRTPARWDGTQPTAIAGEPTATTAGPFAEPAPANGESVTPPGGPQAEAASPVEPPSPLVADAQDGTGPPLVRSAAKTTPAPAFARAEWRIRDALLAFDTTVAGLTVLVHEAVTPLFPPSSTMPDGRTAERPTSGSGSAPSHAPQLPGGATASGGGAGAAAGALLVLLLSVAAFSLQRGMRLSTGPDVLHGQAFLAVIERPG
jgi:hypothetical protein